MDKPHKILQREFQAAWAEGLSRSKIAERFERSQSWVQLMTEICQVPPRRITLHNRRHLLDGAPDDRLARRAYYKATAELKRALFNLQIRSNELKQLEVLCAQARTPLYRHRAFSRRLTLVKLAMFAVSNKTENLRRLACLDPLIADASEDYERVRPFFDEWSQLKKKPAREKPVSRT